MGAQNLDVLPVPFILSGVANRCPTTVLLFAGNRLYPLIHSRNPELAPKFTGMLLQLPPADIISLIEDPAMLSTKLDEAVKVCSCVYVCLAAYLYVLIFLCIQSFQYLMLHCLAVRLCLRSVQVLESEQWHQ